MRDAEKVKIAATISNRRKIPAECGQYHVNTKALEQEVRERQR